VTSKYRFDCIYVISLTPPPFIKVQAPSKESHLRDMKYIAPISHGILTYIYQQRARHERKTNIN
jgi:hypothetical protein